jgi:hypothetical protein
MPSRSFTTGSGQTYDLFRESNVIIQIERTANERTAKGGQTLVFDFPSAKAAKRHMNRPEALKQTDEKARK